MKFVRMFCSILILFIVIAGLSLAALVYFINPNKLKPVIAEQVRKQTGYTVEMDGEFTWSLYPRLGIKVGGIRLFMPQEKKPFVDLGRVVFVTELSELLRGNQKLRGDIYIAELTLLNMRAHNAHVSLRWQDRALNLDAITASMYDGTLVAAARGANLSATPAWGWDAKFNDIDLKALLQDVNGADNKLQLAGKAQLQVRATARGKSREQILNSLNGMTTFAVSQGVVQGIDINYLLKTADAIINKQLAALPTDKLDATSFDSLTGSVDIKNGIASTNNLLLVAPAFAANGTGSFNLMYQIINMQLRITPDKSARTQWLVPMMITGSLSRPDVRLDMNDINMQIAKHKLDDVKNKVRDEVKQRVHGKAGEILQNLLSR